MGPTYSLAGTNWQCLMYKRREVFMEWIGELMFLVSPHTPNLSFSAALVTIGLEGVGQQSVSISLPSSILLNTLTLSITDKTNV